MDGVMRITKLFEELEELNIKEKNPYHIELIGHGAEKNDTAKIFIRSSSLGQRILNKIMSLAKKHEAEFTLNAYGAIEIAIKD